MTGRDDILLPLTVAGVKFRNPFFVASGPTTMRVEQIKKIEATGWGGASLKLTLDPPPYINRRPRYGYYAEQGYLTFTAEKRLKLDELLKLIDASRKATKEIVLFSNLTYAGDDGVDGWVRMAKACEDAGVHVNELNMCCPNMSFNVEMSGADKGGPKTGASLGQNEQAIADIVRAVKAATRIPLFVKITPEGGNQPRIAKAALDAGADAVGSNGNRLAVPPIDLDRPTKSQYHLQEEIGMACMNSRWLLPLGKRDVYQIRRAAGPGAALTACGGVTEWRDAVEMAMCGADLVGICAATLIYGYGFMPEFVAGVKQFMAERGFKDWRELRDIVVPAITAAPNLTLYEGHAEKKDERLAAPCRDACPMQLPIQGILARVADKRFREAYDLIQSCGPFQEICSRICDHPCEKACVRGDKDAPLNILEVKRFVMETARREGCEPDLKLAPSTGKKVAVAGAGPAGLSAAFHLARAGHSVTVFERDAEAGGTVRRYIPAFRMDRAHIDREVERLKKLGVQFRFNTTLGGKLTPASLKAKGYAALFLATGAQQGLVPEVQGADLAGCTTGVEFIGRDRDIKGRTVVVVGGGFTALDAARTAVRRGAKRVYILYRRTRAEMPATDAEVTEAEEECIRIIYQAAPEGIFGAGRVEGVRAAVHTLGGADASGRRRPEPVTGSNFNLAADIVVFAVSQAPELRLAGVAMDGQGRVTVNTRHATSKGWIFAGGDCVTGPQNIVGAVRAGYDAAASIDRKLRGKKAVLAVKEKLTVTDRETVLLQYGTEPRQPRMETKHRPVKPRLRNGVETTAPLTEAEAVREAARCLACGCGAGCEVCATICTVFAWSVETGRTVLDKDKCVACGMCIWRCPRHNIGMKQTSAKPV
ncbi:MAG: FAD-dependent oxidoreductase [Planctomycetota bacterium]